MENSSFSPHKGKTLIRGVTEPTDLQASPRVIPKYGGGALLERAAQGHRESEALGVGPSGCKCFRGPRG